jgi:hypothetical protein
MRIRCWMASVLVMKGWEMRWFEARRWNSGIVYKTLGGGSRCFWSTLRKKFCFHAKQTLLYLELFCRTQTLELSGVSTWTACLFTFNLNSILLELLRKFNMSSSTSRLEALPAELLHKIISHLKSQPSKVDVSRHLRDQLPSKFHYLFDQVFTNKIQTLQQTITAMWSPRGAYSHVSLHHKHSDRPPSQFSTGQFSYQKPPP